LEIHIINDKVVVEVGVSTIILTLFILYCTLEVLRIAYIGGRTVLPLSIGLLTLGTTVIVGLRKHLARNKAVTSECGHLFPTMVTKSVIAFHATNIIFSIMVTKSVIAFHVASIILILSTTTVLLVNFPSFLIVQLLLLATLWLDNRRLNVSLNMLRTSLVFTVIYVSCVLFLTKNMFMGLVALVYFFSWLHLQIKIEQPAIQGSTSLVAK
jgi:hypothetical protein